MKKWLETDSFEEAFEKYNDNMEEIEQNLTEPLILKNEVVNGDFSNGTTGWVSHLDRATLSVSSKIASLSGLGISTNCILRQPTSSPFVAGKKIYVRARARVTNSDCVELRLNVTNTGFSGAQVIESISNPIQNTWYSFSNAVELMFDLNTINYNFYNVYATPEASLNKTMQIDGVYGVVAIDLTQTFGEGNEPTKEEMDEIIKITGWFDNEYALSNKEMLIALLNMIRKNTMAIIALGGTQ